MLRELKDQQEHINSRFSY